MAITWHFIGSDFKLVGKTPTTAVFSVEDAKTGKNTRKEILCLLVNKFDLDLTFLNKIVWVTDQGSSIVKALEAYRRIDCIDHLINTVLRHGLDPNSLAENAPEIGETIVAAKALRSSHVQILSPCVYEYANFGNGLKQPSFQIPMQTVLIVQ